MWRLPKKLPFTKNQKFIGDGMTPIFERSHCLADELSHLSEVALFGGYDEIATELSHLSFSIRPPFKEEDSNA